MWTTASRAARAGRLNPSDGMPDAGAGAVMPGEPVDRMSAGRDQLAWITGADARGAGRSAVS